MVVEPNSPPEVEPISAPADPVRVGTPVEAAASFVDPNEIDVHAAVWDWGDGSASEVAVAESEGSGTVSGQHAYGVPGLYTVTLTVDDQDGGVTSVQLRFVVVYDPAGGFVTGGGWIDSPPGAYVPDSSLTGKATFGFNAKYKNGDATPSGQTEFHLRVADLEMHADTYVWLVVAGVRAQLEGTGTIDGEGGYGFLMTAVDGAGDTLRMRIWSESTGEVLYDTQPGDPEDADPTTGLGGGSIVVHAR